MQLHKVQVEYLSLNAVKNYHRKLRKSSKKQLEKTQRMIHECGYMPPTVIDKDKCIVIGEYFVEAARKMGLEEIPTISVEHLSEQQIRTLRIAYDRISEEAVWDPKMLAEEFRELEITFPDIDLSCTGFEVAEIDIMLNMSSSDDEGDDVPLPAEGPAVIKLGELWQLGEHKLYCGDSLFKESYEVLMAGEKAQLCFTDAPYNVKIDGHVGNSGKIKHREFVQGSGELSSEEFKKFLLTAHKHMAENSADGTVIFSCIDWRHLREILSAGSEAGLNLLNLCVWKKDNGGMGSLYRSQHELVMVFKHGTGKHVNNIELGKHGRYRTNVWEYPGVNSFGSGRMDELAMHPTVKPLAMVVDAIKDCSKRGSIVLDPFGGSGTTLIAAEKTGRLARLIELDPLYCDVIIRRWQGFSGKEAVNMATGKSFNQQKVAEVKNEQ